MKRKSTVLLGFALLLTLLLPIAGYGAMPGCPSAMVAQGQHHHCPTAPTLRHHDCGGCTCAAFLALNSLPWVAPPRTAAAHWDSPVAATPLVELDRLDRPPRFARA